MAPAETSRPILLPQNRKLRHLQGIYIRNLTLARPRGQTIDDAGLNRTTLQLEHRPQTLHHTRSSSANPRPAKPRRASTNWAGASPGVRQKKLEDAIENRTADTFFSLHCEGQEEPIYISEVVEKAMNPTFRFFDLSVYGPSTTRLDTATVKVWVRKQEEFTLLFEEQINLRSLQFLGTLENHIFSPNCILFHLIDGVYTVDMVLKTSKPPKSAAAEPTSSYNALMRLSNLDESIQDALATRESLASQINAILAEIPVDEIAQSKERLALTQRYIATARKQLNASIKRRDELKASIAARQAAMNEGSAVQARAQADVSNAQEKLEVNRSLINKNTSQMLGQRRRICEELIQIFPIEPTEHPLLFTICGIPLANSSFDDVSSAQEDLVSAALGHVAQLVNLLQYYLSVPLPYPITPYQSRSVIHDSISILQDSQRVFPLYMKGTVRFRFDYGVYLLNKNIEALAESQGLKVLDIRQTVPNLKYLLYICSAGQEELPERKRGGIKGLLIGRGGSLAGSRRGSDESARGTQVDALRDAVESQAAGITSKGKSMIKEGYQSLRTSGLRENVVS